MVRRAGERFADRAGACALFNFSQPGALIK
jgi:hypothetical protein